MRLKVLDKLELKVHYMSLQNDPFEKIKSKSKTIEMRLFDEKRQLLNINDYIIFTNSFNNEIIKCQIVNLYQFKSFKELYENFDPICLGYEVLDTVSYHDMEMYYSIENINKYGVLAIEVKVL